MTALDLSTLTLTCGSHHSRNDGVCLLEAVAWFAGEQHSDHPACVCPVLAAYGRMINDLAPQDVRDRLREFVPRLVGTNASGEVELQRAYLFADAAVRVFAPMALESAGLADQAAKLRCLPVVVDRHSANMANAAARSASASSAVWSASWSASADTSAQDRRTLALFTETLDFDATQQKRLLPHLWSYVLENRTSRNRDELVALGAAIRTFIAYLPSSQFDVLPELLAPDETAPVSADMELEVVKGLFYRLTWDTDAKSIPCPRLRDALYDLAMFHSSKRAVQNDISNAIAVESIIILALFNDSRVESLCKSFPQHSMPWFSRVVEVRAKHLLSRLMRENRDSTVSLGLLPVLAKSSATSNGK